MTKIQYGFTVAAACVCLLVVGFVGFSLANDNDDDGGKVKKLKDLNCM